jgi:large subunit ribosomal protein L20
MNGLKISGIEINRKMLSEMAVSDSAGFAILCEKARAAVAK